MKPRTISNQMMINLNHRDIQNYKEKVGIKKHYKGPLKQLVEVTFPDELNVETEPPVHYDVDVGLDIEDEIAIDTESDSESDEENEDNVDTETDTDEDSD